MSDSATVQKTFLFDSLQVFVRGILDTGPKTFFLLIAVRYFDASELIKSLLAAPTFIGMIGSLFVWKALSRAKLPLTTLSSLVRVMVGGGFLVSSLVDNIHYYALMVVATCILLPINISLQTSIYKENYPVKIRGKMFGWSMVFNLLGSILFHWLIGIFLDGDISKYRYVLALYGLASLISALFIYQIPKPQNVPKAENQHLLGSFKLIFQDKLFGYMLLVWYVFGFGNLIIFPMRVIYLTDASFGINLPVAWIALIAGAIPDIFRVLFTPLWGYLFDRINFIKLRIILNILLFASIFLFFVSKSLWVIILGNIIFGIFFAGGSLAWMLWVTHYAPPGKTGQYMSLHVFFTGTRGVMGAFLGIYLVEKVGLTPVWIMSLVLCGVSILMLLPVVRFGNFKDRTKPFPLKF